MQIRAGGKPGTVEEKLCRAEREVSRGAVRDGAVWDCERPGATGDGTVRAGGYGKQVGMAEPSRRKLCAEDLREARVKNA